jgi:enamine deaminase RidA (YjgF/YER057c/UK114 family)
VPAVDGEIITGGIVEQTHQTMKNLIAILEEAGYGLEDVVRAGRVAGRSPGFQQFQQGLRRVLQAEHAPARACVQANMMVDCKVEIDCIAYKKKAELLNRDGSCPIRSVAHRLLAGLAAKRQR